MSTKSAAMPPIPTNGLYWIAPVESVADLPSDAAIGTACCVNDELNNPAWDGGVWLVNNEGNWQRVIFARNTAETRLRDLEQRVVQLEARYNSGAGTNQGPTDA